MEMLLIGWTVVALVFTLYVGWKSVDDDELKAEQRINGLIREGENILNRDDLNEKEKCKQISEIGLEITTIHEHWFLMGPKI